MSTSRSAERCLLILLDGLGDRAYPKLGDRTPLQAAHTPNLDAFAQRGSCGLLHAARQGIALPSENAHFTLFGYQEQEFPGRGLFEALGAGLDIRPGDIAFLVHFGAAEVRERTLILRKHRPKTTTERNKGLYRGNRLIYLVREGWNDRNRALQLIICRPRARWYPPAFAEKDSAAKSQTPALPSMTIRIAVAALPKAEDLPAAQRTAEALNSYIAWSHTTLSKHP